VFDFKVHGFLLPYPYPTATGLLVGEVVSIVPFSVILSSLKMDWNDCVRICCVFTVQIPGLTSGWGWGCSWAIPGALQAQGGASFQGSTKLELTGIHEVCCIRINLRIAENSLVTTLHSIPYWSVRERHSDSNPKFEEMLTFWLVASSLYFTV
jgi:hypothetical protein